jgi:radical SAM protein with 4Fe4S-binding SPASM domain
MHQPSRGARLPEGSKNQPYKANQRPPKRLQPNENKALIQDQTIGRVSFLWLEITGKCQLECVHCYAESGPSGTHGILARSDWEQVLDQAHDLGVNTVQFIGGEPTLHPDIEALINYALRQGLLVEVYTNLVNVSLGLWEVFSQPGVSLATSYYTDNPHQHESITQRRGSYLRTKANIIEAVRRAIPLRVEIVHVHDDQRVQQARRELEVFGVQKIGIDRLRQVGRGICNQQPDISQLCGNCGGDFIAIFPDGTVSPCPIFRWATIGNVQKEALASILGRQELTQNLQEIKMRRYNSSCSSGQTDGACGPNEGPERGRGVRLTIQ